MLHLLDQIGQTVIVGMTDFASKNAETVRQSKLLVEDTLQKVAPAVYKGAVIATADMTSHKAMAEKLGLTHMKAPFLYSFNMKSRMPIIYSGDLDEDSIRVWAQDIIKKAMYGEEVDE